MLVLIPHGVKFNTGGCYSNTYQCKITHQMVKLTPTGVKINTSLVWTSHNTGGVKFNTRGFCSVIYWLFVNYTLLSWVNGMYLTCLCSKQSNLMSIFCHLKQNRLNLFLYIKEFEKHVYVVRHAWQSKWHNNTVGVHCREQSQYRGSELLFSRYRGVQRVFRILPI